MTRAPFSRAVLTWDGSGHAYAALTSTVALLRSQALDHLEIVLGVWPPREGALWTDIRERQAVSDDLHRAAQETAADDGARLRELLAPYATSLAVAIESGDISEVLRDAVARVHADLLVIVLGPNDPGGVISERARHLVLSVSVPSLILRAPA